MKDLHIDQMDEGMLYFTIHSLGGGIWMVEHDLADGRYEGTPETLKWLEDARKAQIEAVSRLDEFGVNTDGGKSTAEYWQWYNWWRNWNRAMDEVESKLVWDKVNQLQKQGIYTLPDDLRPDGDWRLEQ